MAVSPANAQVFGNMTTAGEEPAEGFGEIAWIMSHINKAASLVSAHTHVHSGLGVKPFCVIHDFCVIACAGL